MSFIRPPPQVKAVQQHHRGIGSTKNPLTSNASSTATPFRLYTCGRPGSNNGAGAGGLGTNKSTILNQQRVELVSHTAKQQPSNASSASSSPINHHHHHQRTVRSNSDALKGTVSAPGGPESVGALSAAAPVNGKIAGDSTLRSSSNTVGAISPSKSTVLEAQETRSAAGGGGALR